MNTALYGLVAYGLVAGVMMASSLPAAAQSSHAVLGKGEVALEVLGKGVSVRPADSIMFACSLKAKADTEAAARAALATRRSALDAALGKAGIAAKSLDFGSGAQVSRRRDYGDADDIAAAAAGAAAAAAASDYDTKAKYAYFATHDFKGNVSSIAHYNAIKDVPGISCPGEPLLTLADAAGARQDARKLALKDARDRAEENAAALNLTVLRIVRVNEASALEMLMGPEFVAMMRDEGPGRWRKSAYSEQGKIATNHSVMVEFVLGPK